MSKSIAKIRYIFLIIPLVAITLVYISNYIQPILHYQIQQPSFLNDSDYFHQHIIYPGGLAEYISDFLMQLFYTNFLGALIYVALAVIISLLIQTIIQRVFTRNRLIIFTVAFPFLIISALVSNYLFPLSVLVKISMALLFTLFYTISKETLFFKIPGIIVLSGFLYWISGGIALYLFSALTILIQTSKSGNSERFVMPIFIAIVSLIIPIFSYHFVFNISANVAYVSLIPDSPVMHTYQINKYIYALLGFIIITFLFEFISYLTQNSTGKLPRPRWLYLKRKNVTVSLQLIILAVCGYILIQHSSDKRLKYQALVNYYAYNEDWHKVLKCAKKAQGYDYKINFETNRALYHLGMFSEDMFSYPQLLGSQTLFIDNKIAGEITEMASDLYFDLGHIYESLRWAYESQTLLPYSPRILKQIIIGNLIIGNYNSANTYIRLLKKNFRYKKWAEKYELYITDHSLTEKDKLIVNKRKLLPQSCISPINDPVVVLESLLKSNPENNMAFEYLEAYYLLNHDLGLFMKNLYQIGNFNYKKMPKSFEEAIILFAIQKPDGKISNYQISKGTQENLKDFRTILASAKGNKELARHMLAKYSGTYWYYLAYLSPYVTKNQIKTRDVK
jgi:hypothetical protein